MATPKTKTITFSVVLPVSVTAVVKQNGDGDLTIESIRDLDCQATPRSVSEQMDEDDFEGMRQAFARAK